MNPPSLEMGPMILRVVFGLGVVLLAVAAVAWLLKRAQLGRQAARSAFGPELVASLTLGPRHTVHLLRVCGEGVLVGASREGVRALGTFPLAGTKTRDETRAAGSTDSTFLDLVSDAFRRQGRSSGQ